MIVRILGKLEEVIIACLLISITLLVFLEVVLRFGFNMGLLWLEELTLHLAGWFVLFGASYGVKVGAHIEIDLFVKALKEKTRRAVNIFALGASVLYCGLIIYGAVVYLEKIQRFGIEMEDFEFPKWIAHSVLVFGFLLLGGRILHLLWRTYKGEAEGFFVVDEAAEVLEELHAQTESEGVSK